MNEWKNGKRGTMEELEDFRNLDLADLEKRFSTLTEKIFPSDAKIRDEALKRWSLVAKPLGSLGVLEDDIARICAAQRGFIPDIYKRALIIFCADNGIVEEGVSQTGQNVTASVMQNITYGRSCSSLMATHAKTDVFPIDIGVACDIDYSGDIHPLTIRKIRRGTSNFTKECSMSRKEVLIAILTGIDSVRVLEEQGYQIAAVGEMGIGNTTTSSAIASVILDKDPSIVTGHGAGLDTAGLNRKTDAIRRGIALHRPDPQSGLNLLETIGGFDLAAMAGVFLGGAIYHIPIVIDGFIAETAASVAKIIAGASVDYMLAAHVSAEPAAIWLLSYLGLNPAVNAGLRLGEGTGAITLFPLLDMALSVYTDMDTFSEMNIEAYRPL